MVRAKYRGPGAGHGQGAWPVLLLLLVAVVVPTACVLWFMTEAMRNERLAIRQKLTEAYRGQLLAVQSQLQTHWEDRAAALAGVDLDAGAGEAFADLVGEGLCDSVIIYDRSGRVRYPVDVQTEPDGQAPETAEWIHARRLEYEENDAGAAAASYATIAEQAADVNLAARALQARARCLGKTGRTGAAIDILARTLADDKYRNARTPDGHLIAPGAQLYAIRLMHVTGDVEHPDYHSTLASLVQRLTGYEDPTLPSSQRRFLMHQVQTVVPDCPPLPTLVAEDLAADYLESHPPGPAVPDSSPPLPADPLLAGTTDKEGPCLRPSRLPSVWQLVSPGRRLVALFTQDRIAAEAQSLAQTHVSLADVSVKLVPRTARARRRPPLIVVSAGEYLLDWELALYVEGADPLSEAADKRIVIHLWTGILVIVVITALALLVARYVSRQMKLTRLKNDLIATVSHELKTPLASMRALVDTLIEGRYRDRHQVDDYLQLIARENTRLSRLIDNFLTFSRMERNKRTFEFADLRVEETVNAAVEAVRERFTSAGCRLDVELSDDLPAITGDRDALITVILNLLDNAHKYSEDDRHVILRAYAADAHVCLEVEDNGIGLSRRATKRIFDRFYQVDQSLSRPAGGCGLGLSIVRFIVQAHGGTISVTSQPGKGSTFTVRLPVGPNDE